MLLFAENLVLRYFSVTILRLLTPRHIFSKTYGMMHSPKLRHPGCWAGWWCQILLVGAEYCCQEQQTVVGHLDPYLQMVAHLGCDWKIGPEKDGLLGPGTVKG